MNLYNVYPLQDVAIEKASGCNVWDDQGTKYLDLYGGHAVISIGHSHPHYVKRIAEQLGKIGFYSNSVKMPLQKQLAEKLGQVSGCQNYELFLCNSGAEANENALKIASFISGRKKVIAFRKAFHGRTSGAVAATDNPKIVAPYNSGHEVTFLPFNDKEAFANAISKDVAAVIIEGIQGVGGIHIPEADFLQFIAQKCKENGSYLILDEIQSGYGRSGRFFSHQYAGIKPDLITTAKGMGNGFPIGGVLVNPALKAWSGMLGTTFGGNYLACAAALAVLEVMEKENLMAQAAAVGNYLLGELRKMPQLLSVRGMGLMIGFDLPAEMKNLRQELLFKHKIFTGNAQPNTIRLLPPLTITKEEADIFLKALKSALTVG